jgi:hypothetical protein
VSGFMVRAGFVSVAACALLLSGAAARADEPERTPVVPIVISDPAFDLPVVATAAPAGDALATPVTPPTAATGTAIPLPPGVYVGLVGLASAAVARWRYLKRR